MSTRSLLYWFVALMDQHLPGWQLIRAEMQEGLLSYQTWEE